MTQIHFLVVSKVRPRFGAAGAPQVYKTRSKQPLNDELPSIFSHIFSAGEHHTCVSRFKAWHYSKVGQINTGNYCHYCFSGKQ